jgi:serine/threonine-protein kinase RsbT
MLAVRGATDPQCCQRAARRFALALGFPPEEASAVAIAVTELATNIVEHAGQGLVRLCRVDAPPGIEVVATDLGPGIADVALALQDGFSRGRFRSQALLEGAGVPPSLGCGLGAVKRLTDVCEIESRPGAGTTVTARKWLRGGQR